MTNFVRDALMALGRLKAAVNDRTGGIAPFFALLLVPLLGSLGAAIDYGAAVGVRDRMQEALDIAVLEGARVAKGGAGTDTVRGKAETSFDQNIVGVGLTDITRSFTPSSGLVAGVATATQDTSFIGILGIETIDIQVTAQAAYSGSGPCIYIMAATASQALLMNGGAHVTAKGCEVHVHSTGNPAAMFNSNTTLDTAKTCIKSTKITKNGGTQTNLSTGCAAAANPYAGTIPAPSSATCTYNGTNYNGGTITLWPGVYCGGINFNGTSDITLQPGTYVIKNGDWNVNGGKMRGDGVTIYYAGTAKIQFNSGMDIDLKAPTSGTYKDILFAENEANSLSSLVFNSSIRERFQGIMHLPRRNVTFNAKSDVQGEKFVLVVNTLILNTVTWSLSPMSGGGGGDGVYLAH